ncbi:hypothetical protein ABZZ17_35815 [Streptomyces sp. NPDC006512]|uniref:hypothetical protein n=1 Tax=Streptomyces sp. NPDC006512 TaxID=3154307 RepID=UPI0033B59C10
MPISEMFRPVRGTGHILDVLDVLHHDQVALRIHDGAFSAMDLTARHPPNRRAAIDDITDDDTTVTVRRGDPPSPLPDPVAALMRADTQSRQHLPYASRSSQWLFPDRQPGQPMNPVSLQVHQH